MKNVEASTLAGHHQTIPKNLVTGPVVFLNGQWQAAANNHHLAVINPATLEQLGEVANGGALEAVRAVDAASAAFESWSSMAGRERSRYLLRLGEELRRSSDDIARIITLEAGKPFKQARDEARSAAAFLSWYGEEAKRVYGTVIPSAQRDKQVWVTRKPVGVVAAITPWNFPLGLMARKVGAALAAGCTVMVKPAPETPLVALAFARLCQQVEMPAGTINIVTGDAPAIGAAWLGDRRVRAVSFTGSTEVGRLLARQAAENLQRIGLELGGSAPYLVFADGDLDQAVTGLLHSKIRNAGQVCAAPNRIYVERPVYEQFLTRLKRMVDSVKVGNGLHPQSQMGPLINEAAYRKVAAMVEAARSAGAEVYTGGQWAGEPDERRGWFWQPQVVSGVTDDSALMQEEAFGPVLTVAPFDEEKEVLARANRSPYGLGAYVFTRDLNRALRLADRLESGIIGINDPLPAAIEAPFGGTKESGYGREGGASGLLEFTEERTVSVQLA